MAILRNIHVARKYNVTPATVGNWIELAKNRRINLSLTTINGRSYIEDTDLNHLELQRLKNQGVKHRAKSTSVRITPDPKIYKIFTEDQLISLFANISYYNMIPVKFSYTDVGAQYYNAFFKESLNNVKSAGYKEMSIINSNFLSIVGKFEGAASVNLVEVGTGNIGSTAKSLIEEFKKNNQLSTYISISSSDKMLEIRKKDLEPKIKNKISSYKMDIEENVIRNILFKENKDLKTRNLCLVLQGFLGNVRNTSVVLSNLAESMSNNDYICMSVALVDENSVDKTDSKVGDNFEQKHIWLLEVLGISKYIDTKHYEYDAFKKLRSSHFTLLQNVEIVFQIDGREIVLYLERDRVITFFINYRFTLTEVIKLFDDAKLRVEQYHAYKDGGLGLFLVRPA